MHQERSSRERERTKMMRCCHRINNKHHPSKDDNRKAEEDSFIPFESKTLLQSHHICQYKMWTGSRSFVGAFALAVCLSSSTVWAFAPTNHQVRRINSPLHHAPAPKHDVGENPLADFTPEQRARAEAYMEHQQNVPKVGFPTDVRSLVQYNHGFAVMSTNSKS